MGREETGTSFPEVVPSLLTWAGVGFPLLTWNPLWLAWQQTSCLRSGSWATLWWAGLRKHTRDFSCLHFLSLLWQPVCLHPAPCSISAAPLFHLCSAQFILPSILWPFPTRFLARLSHSNPFPILQKLCVHLALTRSLPQWLVLHLPCVLLAPTNIHFGYRFWTPPRSPQTHVSYWSLPHLKAHNIPQTCCAIKGPDLGTFPCLVHL